MPTSSLKKSAVKVTTHTKIVKEKKATPPKSSEKKQLGIENFLKLLIPAHALRIDGSDYIYLWKTYPVIHSPDNVVFYVEWAHHGVKRSFDVREKDLSGPTVDEHGRLFFEVKDPEGNDGVLCLAVYYLTPANCHDLNLTACGSPTKE